MLFNIKYNKKKPLSIVVARIIVWVPIIGWFLFGFVTVMFVQGGLTGRGQSFPIQNVVYQDVHDFFGWEHSDDNLWKAILIGSLIFSIIAVYLTLYWQSRKSGNFQQVLTLVAATFIIAITTTFLFGIVGYYLLFISIIMLGLFMTSSSRNFYSSTKEEFPSHDDILDANL